ncbi:MAG: S9 family peptidase, partial [Planctomycetales bacterium]
MFSPRAAVLLIGSALLSASAGPTLLRAEEPADALRPPAVKTEEVPPLSAETVERLRQYQNTRSAGFRGWSPLGLGVLVATRFGETTQLHRVLRPGGRREQVTFFREPVGGRFLSGSWSERLLLTMSQGGNENYQIHLLDRHLGTTTLLTDGKSRNRLGPVRENGSQLAFTSNRRNGRDTDVYVLDPERPDSAKMVLQTDAEYWSPYDFSPDGSRLLLNRYVSINESYPAILDLKTGTKK